jgi:hypothetical protein
MFEFQKNRVDRLDLWNFIFDVIIGFECDFFIFFKLGLIIFEDAHPILHLLYFITKLNLLQMMIFVFFKFDT